MYSAKNKFYTALFFCLIFVACSKEPKNVQFYKEHEAERAAVIQKYKDNPGKYKNDPDVINAFEAQRHNFYEGWTNKGARVVKSKIDKLH